MLAAPLTAQKRHRYYEGSDSRRPHQDDGSHRLLRLAFPSFRPQPRKPSDGRFPQSSQRQRLFQASPCFGRLATGSRRIRFVLLQTDSSLPAAPHPASRRRSCLPLQSHDALWRGLTPRRQDALTDAPKPTFKSAFGNKSHGSQRPHRTGVVIAKRPKRSGGPAKQVDDDGPMWPPSIYVHAVASGLEARNPTHSADADL